MVNFLVAFYHY